MQHATAPMFQARPGLASGALCFSGTKIRAETLFNHLRDSGTIERFLEEFEGAADREQSMCAIETAAKEFVQRREGQDITANARRR